jgi:hypothetical protein
MNINEINIGEIVRVESINPTSRESTVWDGWVDSIVIGDDIDGDYLLVTDQDGDQYRVKMHEVVETFSAEDDEHDQFRSDAEADGDALASAGMGTDEDYGPAAYEMDGCCGDE